MSIKDLIPSRKGKSRLPARREGAGGLFALQDEMNRLFDEFFDGFNLAPFRGMGDRLAAFEPRVDVKETDKEVAVAAELPGLDEKDVEVTLDDGYLTIRGEKKDEREEKDGNWHRTERTYGSFHRVIPLPVGAQTDKAKASFKKGVLRVTLPREAKATENRKTIEIQAE